MTYRPRHVKQLDGSRCGSANCGPASNSMAVARDWLGVRVGDPVAIRNSIGLYCPGTNSTQNDAAVRKLYATVMTPAFDMPWGTWLDGLAAGRGSCIVIRYSVLHGTPFDSCRTFDGLHWIYVNERRWNADTGRYEDLVGDPLADGRYPWIPRSWQWWPESLLQQAAEAVQADHYVDASFTRDTIGRAHRVLYSGGALRAKPNASSARLGSLPVGAVLETGQSVEGGAWTVSGRQGDRWVPTAVAGVSGWAALGWFQGPTGEIG